MKKSSNKRPLRIGSPNKKKASIIPKKPRFYLSAEPEWLIKDKLKKVNNRLPEAKLRYPCLVLRDRNNAPRFVLAYKFFSVQGKPKVAITYVQRERTQYTKISNTREPTTVFEREFYFWDNKKEDSHTELLKTELGGCILLNF